MIHVNKHSHSEFNANSCVKTDFTTLCQGNLQCEVNSVSVASIVFFPLYYRDRLIVLPTREICLCFLSQRCPLPLSVKTYCLLVPHIGAAEVEFTASLFEDPEIDHGIRPNLLNLTQQGWRVAFCNYLTYALAQKEKFPLTWGWINPMNTFVLLCITGQGNFSDHVFLFLCVSTCEWNLFWACDDTFLGYPLNYFYFLNHQLTFVSWGFSQAVIWNNRHFSLLGS